MAVVAPPSGSGEKTKASAGRVSPTGVRAALRVAASLWSTCTVSASSDKRRSFSVFVPLSRRWPLRTT